MTAAISLIVVLVVLGSSIAVAADMVRSILRARCLQCDDDVADGIVLGEGSGRDDAGRPVIILLASARRPRRRSL
jgi:hypothetical protein